MERPADTGGVAWCGPAPREWKAATALKRVFESACPSLFFSESASVARYTAEKLSPACLSRSKEIAVPSLIFCDLIGQSECKWDIS